MLPPFCRNAPCPPASWIDSGSVHPWHYVWVSHAAVPGADWLCCQREQHSCGPTGRGESGRPGQCDGSCSGRTWDRLIIDDSLCIHTHQSVRSSILSVSHHLAVLLSCHLYVQWRRESVFLSMADSGQCAGPVCLQKLSWKSQNGFWLYVLHMGASVSCSQLVSGKASCHAVECGWGFPMLLDIFTILLLTWTIIPGLPY